MDRDAVERAAMQRALRLAADGPGAWTPNPNPRVGCVLLSAQGDVVAEGFHRGAGTPHAEVAALAAAGDRARGATAVVTLEPCHHTGRTGPCSRALLEAGVTRVVFAQSDPNPAAAGGAGALRAGGVDVEAGLLADEAERLNAAWTAAVRLGRPHVLWKLAATLDGRSAAADGSSRWVSSAAARRDTHRLRAGCDTILVGTNTIAVDDPLLTVREGDRVVGDQLRAVMGLRELDPGHRVFNDDAPTTTLRTRDPAEALAALGSRGRFRVFLEGGPTLAAAFLRAGLVDQVVAYVAPMLLGAGRAAVGDLGITTIGDALHLAVTDVLVLGDGPETNVRLTMQPKGA